MKEKSALVGELLVGAAIFLVANILLVFLLRGTVLGIAKSIAPLAIAACISLWYHGHQIVFVKDRPSTLREWLKLQRRQFPELRRYKVAQQWLAVAHPLTFLLAIVLVFFICAFGHIRVVRFVTESLWGFTPEPTGIWYDAVLAMAFLTGGIAGVQAFLQVRRLKASAREATQRALLNESLSNEMQRIIDSGDRGELLEMAAHYKTMMTAFNGSPRTLERRHEYPEEFKRHQLSIESTHDTLKLFALYNTLHKAAETQARKLAEAAGGYWELPHDTYDGTELSTYAPVWVSIDPPKQG